jgi:hypothetical protein
MNFGFNSNVRSGDTVYHVQTEDRGPSHPYLDTVVYEAGRVVYKRSTSYADFAKSADAGGLQKQLHERLAQQHHEVINELEAGMLPLIAQPVHQPNAVPVAAGEGLDVRLKNPKTWFASGQATLEIELRQRNSDEEIGNADIEALLEHERDRTPCARGRTDAAGHATLKFSMPATVKDGASLVIRATDGSLYGELRFRLKAKPRDAALAPASTPVSK